MTLRRSRPLPRSVAAGCAAALVFTLCAAGICAAAPGRAANHPGAKPSRRAAVSPRSPSSRGASRAAGIPGLHYPATFTGTLPCADCPGLRTSVTLLAGGHYIGLVRYLTRPGGSSMETGRWTYEAATHRVLLGAGAAAPRYYAVQDTSTLRMLDAQGNPIDPTSDFALRSGADSASGAFELRGMAQYAGDSARFSECATGLGLPIAGGAGSIDLQHACTGLSTGGEPVLASIEGHLATAPRRHGPGREVVLWVDRFSRVMPHESCTPPPSPEQLLKRNWRLVELLGDPVPAGLPEAPTLRLDSDGQRATGGAGCNLISGTYFLDNGGLRFSYFGVTRRFCREAMAFERLYLQVLAGITHARIETRSLKPGKPAVPVLELMDVSGVRARYTEK